MAARRRGVASVVLVHGAGSGPWVFDGWRGAFGEADVLAVDLQAGLVVAQASMENYAAAVVAAGELLEPPLALVGWSMGGLAAMSAARRLDPAALVLLEPSPPAEVQGRDDDVVLAPGTFDPEEVYGPFPAGVAKRPESSLARAERKRGIAVRELAGPTLVVSGCEFADERGHVIAARYGAGEVELPAASHWDLVLADAARSVAVEFVTAA